MEEAEAISSNFFPAKLWRLVNSPEIGAINWNSHGDQIVINTHLFQIQVLSPGINKNDSFKISKYSSFVRQLNLYGFKKARLPNNQGLKDGSYYERFHHPNFKRNYPELVANLQRLTVKNKAKIKAGLEVKCQFMRERPRSDMDQSTGLKIKSSSLQLAQHLSPPPHYSPYQSQAPKPQSWTPVPPRFQAMGPTGIPVFAPVQCVPVFLRNQYCGGVWQGSSSQANGGNQALTRFNLQNAQFPPPCYPSVRPWFCSGLVQPNIPTLQTEFFSAQGMENQEAEKPDINLDIVFQMADDFMPMLPSNQIVQVQTPMEPVGVLTSPPGICKTMPRDDKASTTPSYATLVTVDVSNFPAYKDESVTSLAQQIPEDASFVGTDQGEDDEIVSEVSD